MSSDSSDDDVFGFNRHRTIRGGGGFARPSGPSRPNFQLFQRKKKKKSDVWGDSSSDDGYGSAASNVSGVEESALKAELPSDQSDLEGSDDEHKSPHVSPPRSPVSAAKASLAAKGVSQEPATGDPFASQSVSGAGQKKTINSEAPLSEQKYDANPSKKDAVSELSNDTAAFYQEILDEVYLDELNQYAMTIENEVDQDKLLEHHANQVKIQIRDGTGPVYERYEKRIADIDAENAKRAAELAVSKNTPAKPKQKKNQAVSDPDPAPSHEELDSRLQSLFGKISAGPQPDPSVIEAQRLATHQRIHNIMTEKKDNQLIEQSAVLKKLERLVAKESRTPSKNASDLMEETRGLQEDFIKELEEIYMEHLHTDEHKDSSRWDIFHDHAHKQWAANLDRWIKEAKPKPFPFQKTPSKAQDTPRPAAQAQDTPRPAAQAAAPASKPLSHAEFLQSMQRVTQGLTAATQRSRSGTSKSSKAATSLQSGGLSDKELDDLDAFFAPTNLQAAFASQSLTPKAKGSTRSQTTKSASSSSSSKKAARPVTPASASENEEDEENQSASEEEDIAEELSDGELKAMSKMSIEDLMDKSKDLKHSSRMTKEAKITVLQEFAAAVKRKAGGGDEYISAFRLNKDGTIVHHGQGKMTAFSARDKIKKRIKELKAEK